MVLAGLPSGAWVEPTSHDCLWSHASQSGQRVLAMGYANNETGLITPASG